MNTNKIVDYDILWSENTHKLISAVKNAITEGWKPYGHPYTRDGNKVYQAVVKIERKFGSITLGNEK